MSASLVGSEMCIRDSNADPSAGGSARSAVPPTPASGERGSEFLQIPSRREAVSYTHLTLPTICSV
eukprot:12500190-Alexandrium_andersonii.AAC.1